MLNTKLLALSMGDPLGIGPEIILKAWTQGLADDKAAIRQSFVIGDLTRLQEAANALELEIAFAEIRSPEASDQGKLKVMPSGPAFAGSGWGRVSKEAGKASFDYVYQGIDLAMAGQIVGLVTAPIHKEAWGAAGITYPGHTELLGDRAGVPGEMGVAMMLANAELRVVLASIHIPVSEISHQLTVEQQLATYALAQRAGESLGLANPRIAVAGLNPHAGEGGRFGHEEQELIKPAIETAQKRGLNIWGPYAGDTIFARARLGEFDLVVAQYHDQGLIPVKYMGMHEGVNVTIGLPFVRTSPDHGTAFDLAGTGQANPGSLIQALNYARAMVARSNGLVRS